MYIYLYLYIYMAASTWHSWRFGVTQVLLTWGGMYWGICVEVRVDVKVYKYIAIGKHGKHARALDDL